jgi:hypothetical protein
LDKKKLLKDPLFVLEKFHPLALFVACGLLILMIEKTYSDISLMEKMFFTSLAGPLYFIDIAFESWRIASLHTSRTTEKPNF